MAALVVMPSLLNMVSVEATVATGLTISAAVLGSALEIFSRRLSS
jgi:hypothetical protein